MGYYTDYEISSKDSKTQNVIEDLDENDLK